MVNRGIEVPVSDVGVGHFPVRVIRERVAEAEGQHAKDAGKHKAAPGIAIDEAVSFEQLKRL